MKPEALAVAIAMHQLSVDEGELQQLQATLDF
jgi:hypothetical protein